MNKINLRRSFDNIIKVFKFTIKNTIKNKAFITMMVFTVIGVMGYVFFLAYTNTSATNEVETVTESSTQTLDDDLTTKGIEIIDENGVLQSVLSLTTQPSKVEAFNNVEMSIVEEDIESYKKSFNKDEDKKNTLLVNISNITDGYDINVYTQKETDISEMEMYAFASMIENVYKTGKLSSIGMDNERASVANTAIATEVVAPKEEESAESNFLVKMMFSMLLGMLVYVIIVFSGNNISTQIVTEKSTRLVEFLLVTLRPLELVGGKILAGVAISVMQIGVMGVSILASAYMCRQMDMITSYEQIISLVSLKGMSLDINIINIVLVIVVIVLGIIFYGTLSGLGASTVSKLEEIASANSLYTMISYIGYVASIVLAVSEVDTNTLKILSVIPVTSPFILPTSILLGELKISWTIIAILIQLVIIVLFMKFAAIIYENLILHYGDKVKPKEIIVIIKDYISNHLSSKKSKVGGVNE